MNGTYNHTQRAPLCLLIYVLAISLLVIGIATADPPLIRWLFPPLSLLVLVIAASFHHLTVKDDGTKLRISFGPIPLFQRSVAYADIQHAEVGQTMFLDGWGIHYSLRGGWVWNLWGRECVMVHFKDGGTLRIGTDDAVKLSQFINSKIF